MELQSYHQKKKTAQNLYTRMRHPIEEAQPSPHSNRGTDIRKQRTKPCRPHRGGGGGYLTRPSSTTGTRQWKLEKRRAIGLTWPDTLTVCS